MKVCIQHKTYYRYLEKVFLEPHTLRMNVRNDPFVSILSSQVSVSPEPAGKTWVLENDGDNAMLIWFQGLTDFLNIEAETKVLLQPFNPFDFLIYPTEHLLLPMAYPAVRQSLLYPHLNMGDQTPDVKDFAMKIAKKVDLQTIPFITELPRIISQEFDYEKREEGNPFKAQDTLARGKGSCRDFSVLAMALCRALGLAARYISGYYISEDEDEPSELHAWMEVFLPGAGWKGIDPTHGILCDHHHLALCSAAVPALAFPVSGTFRGMTTASMHTEMNFSAMPTEEDCAL